MFQENFKEKEAHEKRKVPMTPTPTIAVEGDAKSEKSARKSASAKKAKRPTAPPEKTAEEVAAIQAARDREERAKLRHFLALHLRLSGSPSAEDLELHRQQQAAAAAAAKVERKPAVAAASLAESVKESPKLLQRKNSTTRKEKSKESDKELRKNSTAAAPVIAAAAALKPRMAASPFSLTSTLRETVAIGHGLCGWGYAEVVCLLQFLASSRIACMFRCYRKRWRYTSARRRWKWKERQLRDNHFLAWKELTKRIQVNRRYLLRQLVVWRYYTRRAKQRRYLFQWRVLPLPLPLPLPPPHLLRSLLP